MLLWRAISLILLHGLRQQKNCWLEIETELVLLGTPVPRALPVELHFSEGILFRGHLVLSVKKYLTMKCISQDGLGCWYTLRKMFSQRDTADQADQFDESGYVDELFSKRGLKILHQNIRGLIANKNKYWTKYMTNARRSFGHIHIFTLSEWNAFCLCWRSRSTNSRLELQGKDDVLGYIFYLHVPYIKEG